MDNTVLLCVTKKKMPLLDLRCHKGNKIAAYRTQSFRQVFYQLCTHSEDFVYYHSCSLNFYLW